MSQAELNSRADLDVQSQLEREIFAQDQFLRLLALERKRTERSRRYFVLLLVESESLFRTPHKANPFDKILHTLASSSRETDVSVSYNPGSVIGPIFTELGEAA